MKPTFTYVEEYIEFIGGHRDFTGKKLGLFTTVPIPISLARYDVAIVESLASQTAELSKAYTDKQAALAVKIVDKYRKQLANLKVPIIVPEILDQFKHGIRQVDRTKSIYIEDNKFVIRFPYDTKLIDLLRAQTRDGQGSAVFDKEAKVWRLGMTEHMLNWLVTIAPGNGFTVSEQVSQLYDAMMEVEQTPYVIELVKGDTEFTITNAPQSLVDYINTHLGGFGLDNALTLNDNAELLGYKVDPWAVSALFDQYGFNLTTMIAFRRHEFKKGQCTLEEVVEYAKLVNRLPVYVYTNTLPKQDTDEIKYLNRNATADTKPKVLVTLSAMMIGNKKQAWLNNAEKVFFLE